MDAAFEGLEQLPACKDYSVLLKHNYTPFCNISMIHPFQTPVRTGTTAPVQSSNSMHCRNWLFGGKKFTLALLEDGRFVGALLCSIVLGPSVNPALPVSSRFIPEGLQCSCGPDWYTVGTKYKSEYYTWFLFIFCFIVPLTLIIFSYSQLLGALRAVSTRHRNAGAGMSTCAFRCLTPVSAAEDLPGS